MTATFVKVKLNDNNCRAVIATNFSRSFCASSIVKTHKFKMRELAKPPVVKTSDGTEIEFIGEILVQMKVGPWQSEGQIPLLVALDCPTDLLIGEDLIKEIGKKFPVKFEYYKNSINIGGSRVSLLEPLPSEARFFPNGGKLE